MRAVNYSVSCLIIIIYNQKKKKNLSQIYYVELWEKHEMYIYPVNELLIF